MDQGLHLRLRRAAAEIRRDVIRMTYAAGNAGAHIGGSLSLCEIMAALYCGGMRIDPDEPLWPERDRLILSKGHGALAMYAGLRQTGILTESELMTYKQDGSYITAHPSCMPEKGMEFASGSLGQGLSLGVGVCLGLRKKGNRESRVFVLLGDGECAEGSVWEAAASAAHYGLDNLVVIIDRNRIQYDGFTKDVLDMESMAEKWAAFGWQTRVLDGHDAAALYEAFAARAEKPLCLVCDTVKGKGVSFMENDYRWHHSRLSREQFEKAMQEQEDAL